MTATNMDELHEPSTTDPTVESALGGIPKKARHVVVDSAAFLRPCRIEDFGEKIYTVQAVVEEIRDKDTRRRMSVLPYELIIKEPDTESIRIVTEFSKKTGDYPVLSAADIQVIALTHTLHVAECGAEGLRAEPIRNVEITSKPTHAADEMIGFYNPKKKRRNRVRREAEKMKAMGEKVESEEVKEENEEIEGSESDSDEEIDEDDYEDIEEEELEEEEDDGEGWITPKNIARLKTNEVQGDSQAKSHVEVACLTTDFAMQNVLMQMNMTAMGVDGVFIRQIRTYILRCYACFKTTSDSSREFCFHCGNKTLKRVGVTILPDGSRKLHISNRPLNLRGLKYSLPLPKAGKHAHNPVIAEGQPLPQQKPSKKALQKINALDPEYIAGESPFAVNDVYSRASQKGYMKSVPQHSKKNPNECHNPRRRRKKVSGF